jgi:hypothetical protein
MRSNLTQVDQQIESQDREDAQVLQLPSTTRTDPNELARAAATDFAHRLVPHWQQTLGKNLLGAYLRPRST